jgi:hypothetical protein
MPAETHRLRSEPLDASAVLELIWTLVSPLGETADADAHASLDHLDVDDELAKLELWDAAVEEFAERTVAEPDLDELLAAKTTGALAEAILRSLQARRHT